MSTVINVYPSNGRVPTLGEFANAVEAVLIEFQNDPVVERTLGGVDLGSARVLVERLVEGPSGGAPVRISDPATSMAMLGDDYGWLHVDALDAGFDFYFSDEQLFDDVTHRDVVMEYADRAAEIGTLDGFPFARAAGTQMEWWMRLQASQPPRTRLLAGFAAAALARLTEGFIHSEDGGIDYDRGPTDPETFLSWYPQWREEQYLD